MFSWCLVGWSFIYAAGSGFLVVLRAIQMSKSQCDWRPSWIHQHMVQGRVLISTLRVNGPTKCHICHVSHSGD